MSYQQRDEERRRRWHVSAMERASKRVRESRERAALEEMETVPQILASRLNVSDVYVYYTESR